MRKTIIEPDVGENIEAFQQSDRVDGLVHSNGVAIERPGFTRVYLSGMVSFDENENLVGTGDVEVQTRVILENIQERLHALEGSMNDIVRVRVYVTDLAPEDFVTIHEVRSEFFEKEHYPASTLIEVEGLVLEEMKIEIDADAIIPDDGWETVPLEL